MSTQRLSLPRCGTSSRSYSTVTKTIAKGLALIAAGNGPPRASGRPMVLRVQVPDWERQTKAVLTPPIQEGLKSRGPGLDHYSSPGPLELTPAQPRGVDA